MPATMTRYMREEDRFIRLGSNTCRESAVAYVRESRSDFYVGITAAFDVEDGELDMFQVCLNEINALFGTDITASLRTIYDFTGAARCEILTSHEVKPKEYVHAWWWVMLMQRAFANTLDRSIFTSVRRVMVRTRGQDSGIWGSEHTRGATIDAWDHINANFDMWKGKQLFDGPAYYYFNTFYRKLRKNTEPGYKCTSYFDESYFRREIAE